MEIIIQPDATSASQLAARLVAKVIKEKPHAVLGFATGRTPLKLYQNLIILCQEGNLDFSGVTTFTLDEYVGISNDHPASFHAYMWNNLFHHINLPKERINMVNGQAKDIVSYCRQYETAIKTAGGIDLQILGIGRNGHIGFNEPSSSLASRTRIKTLTDDTRLDLAADFGGLENVPNHVITMGLGTIMESKMILLLAFGKNKANAIARAIEGPVTAMVPASILQMHPRAVFILDPEAASELSLASYYKWVYANKPDWQKY